jgi:curved DNA-binding protein
MPTTFKDYYQTLGVSKTATQKEIKSAFRKLARKHHPDVNAGDKAAEERFKEANEAYEVLGDEAKRKKYDEVGPRWREFEQWEQAGRPGPNPFGPQPEVEYRTVSPEDLEDLFGGADPFSDFFHDMFGRPGPRAGARRGTPRPRKGEDVEGETEITLEEAYTGTTRTVEIGSGSRTRRVEVRIPSGITDGARVRAAGQGGPGQGGGASGDLYFRVRIRPHPVFRREADTVQVRVPVPLDVALLGGEVLVPTPRGTSVSLRVPAGTQNGARLRLRGLGMPRLRGGGQGDLIAEVDVRLPVPVPPEVQRLAEALRTQRETVDAG